MKARNIFVGAAVVVGAGAALCVALFVVYAFALSLAFTSGDIPHKSDEELIANFRAHRPEFERLLRMVAEDRGLRRVDDDWTDPADPSTVGAGRERIDEYRRLLRGLGLPRGFSAYGDTGEVEFISSTQGLGVSGSSKSYLHATTPPPNLVESIDRYRAEGRGGYPVYMHIEGDWYLEFDAD